MFKEHGVTVPRDRQAAWLSRATFYVPGIAKTMRYTELVAALQAVGAESPRWSFWTCHDRMRALGHGWNHKKGGLGIAIGVIETWLREQKEERPKKALGGRTPAAYARKLAVMMYPNNAL